MKDLGRIGEALAVYREAQQLFSIAATQLGGITRKTVPWHVTHKSLAVLFELGTLLESANQLVEAEQSYIELLSIPHLPVANRIQCLHSLVHVNNQQKKWGKALQYGKEARAVGSRVFR